MLLICGTRDRTIPCRHAERIYQAATGAKELWTVEAAEHASALGRAPGEYENRVIGFFTEAFANRAAQPSKAVSYTHLMCIRDRCG